jgi:ankyrin repeat protein
MDPTTQSQNVFSHIISHIDWDDLAFLQAFCAKLSPSDPRSVQPHFIIFSDGNSLLHYVAFKDKPVIMKWLIEETDADLTVINKDGCTPLQVAVLNGSGGVITCLLNSSKSALTIQQQDRYGNTPLHAAAYKGNLTHPAAYKGNLTHLGLLIRYILVHRSVAALSLKNKAGATFLDIIINNNSVYLAFTEEFRSPLLSDTIRSLLMIQCLHRAAAQGRVDIVKHFVEDRRVPLIRVGAEGNIIGVDAEGNIIGVDAEGNIIGRDHEGNIIGVDHEGDTPLHSAVENGHESIVDYLLSKEGPQNGVVFQPSILPNLCGQQNRRGETPLHTAAKSGHFSILRKLLSHIQRLVSVIDERDLADIYGRDVQGRTFLHRLAECLGEDALPSGTLGQVDPALLLPMEDLQGNTALLLAVKNRKGPIVSSLLDLYSGSYAKKAAISKRDVAGFMSLHIAAESGDIESIKCLILNSYRPDLWKPNPENKTTIDLLNDHNLLGGLIERNVIKSDDIDPATGDTLLHYAVKYNKYNLVNCCVQYFPTLLNAPNGAGSTPLHLAISAGYSQIIGLLLEERDINPNSQDKNGNTALSLAVKTNNPDLVQVLISEYSVCVNTRDHRNWTPLHTAVYAGYEEVVRILIEVGEVKLDIPNNEGDIALHLAVKAGFITIGRMLIKQAPDLIFTLNSAQRSSLDLLVNDKKSADSLPLWGICEDLQAGENLLHWGARKGSVEFINAFLFKFPDWIEQENKEGLTPLMVAVIAEEIKALDALLKSHSINHNRTYTLSEEEELTWTQFVARYSKNPEIINRASQYSSTSVILGEPTTLLSTPLRRMPEPS